MISSIFTALLIHIRAKLADDYAKSVAEILQNHNWARPITHGEEGFEYIRRVMNEMALREKESPGFIDEIGPWRRMDKLLK